jgi:exodeoxyribonuclease VII small subunit
MKSSSKSSAWNYETTIEQIETIITQIEAGELSLEEVFTQFELAVNSLQKCETFLQQKHQKMQLLIETLDSDFE